MQPMKANVQNLSYHVSSCYCLESSWVSPRIKQGTRAIVVVPLASSSEERNSCHLLPHPDHPGWRCRWGAWVGPKYCSLHCAQNATGMHGSLPFFPSSCHSDRDWKSRECGGDNTPALRTSTPNTPTLQRVRER